MAARKVPIMRMRPKIWMNPNRIWMYPKRDIFIGLWNSFINILCFYRIFTPLTNALGTVLCHFWNSSVKCNRIMQEFVYKG